MNKRLQRISWLCSLNKLSNKYIATVDIPAMRINQTGTTTINNKYLTMPTNMLYVYSLAVIDAANDYHYLINKDVSFIREAYPESS